MGIMSKLFGPNRNMVVTESGHRLYGISEYIAIVLGKYQDIARNSTGLRVQVQIQSEWQRSRQCHSEVH